MSIYNMAVFLSAFECITYYMYLVSASRGLFSE